MPLIPAEQCCSEKCCCWQDAESQHGTCRAHVGDPGLLRRTKALGAEGSLSPLTLEAREESTGGICNFIMAICIFNFRKLHNEIMLCKEQLTSSALAYTAMT